MAEQGPYFHRDEGVDPRLAPLLVYFSEEADRNEVLSAAGPAIYDRRVLLRIVAAGQRNSEVLNEIVRWVAQPNGTEKEKVDAGVMRRFRGVYEQWKSKQTIATTGTPLEEWALMDVKTVAALKDANVFTVQQLTQLPDAILDSIRVPRAREWRGKAIAWLEAAAQAGHDVEARATIERQQRQIDDLKEMVNKLQAKNNSLGFDKKKRRAASDVTEADIPDFEEEAHV